MSKVSMPSVLEERVQRLLARARGAYHFPPDRTWVVASPYRICPLGAHTDHQDGIVTGMTLNHSVLFAFTPSEDGIIRVRSTNFEGEVAFNAGDVPPARNKRDWGNYLRGAVKALTSRHPAPRGIYGFIDGDMPIGGLSSSAAVGVAYLSGLEIVNNLEVAVRDNIALDRLIENDYIGIENGILDQTTILAGRRDHLLVLDCRDASWNAIAAPKGSRPLIIVVAYSGVAESLASTDYNRRVHECREAAARLLQMAGRPVPEQPVLRAVSEEIFDEHGEQLPDNLHRRALHFFTEQQRVRQGIDAWLEGDWSRFGNLVHESGRSSIHQYECGCPPLISLYSILNHCDGVYGARFSGAGFRGCCIGLAEPDAADSIREHVLNEYRNKHPELAEACQVIFCETDDGARVLCAPSS